MNPENTPDENARSTGRVHPSAALDATRRTLDALKDAQQERSA